MSDKVLFQTDDALSEQNLAEQRARENSTDYVERGLSVTPDWTNSKIDVSSGHAVVMDGSKAYDAFPDARTDLGLADGSGMNYVFLVVDPSNQDDISVVINADGSAPAGASLLIAEVDASSETVSMEQPKPDATFTSLKSETHDTERQSISDHLYARGNVGTGRNENSAVSLDGVSIDNFEDLSQWTIVSNDSISLNAETSNPYVGTQSAKIESSESEASVKLEYTFSTPLDLSTARSFSLALWNPQGLTGLSVEFQFRDSSGNSWTTRTSMDAQTYPTDTWFRRDFGDILIDDHDLTEVKEARINFIGGLDSGNAIYVDDPRVIHDSPNKAGVILEIDNPAGGDNNHDAFTIDGEPFTKIFEEYGIPVTMYVDKDEVQNASNVTAEFLRDSQSRGHEVGSKILNSVHDMPTDEIEDNLRQNKEWLLANDLYSAADYYCWTQNDVNKTALEAAQKYYKMARSEGPSGLHGWRLTGTHTHPAQNRGNNPHTTGVDEVNRAIKNNMVAHLYFHLREITASELRQLLDHIRTKALEGELEVKTISDLYAEQQKSNPSDTDGLTLRAGRQNKVTEQIIATADSADLDSNDYLDWQINVPDGIREVEVRLFGLSDSTGVTYSATINNYTTTNYWDVPVPAGTVSSGNASWTVADVDSGARQSSATITFRDYGQDGGGTGFTSSSTGWRGSSTARNEAVRYGGIDDQVKMEGNTIELTGNDTEVPSDFYAVAIGREVTGGGIL